MRSLPLSSVAIAALLFTRSAFSQTPSIPPCPKISLYVTTEDEDGAFDGMSHSGTLLVIRNLGSVPCRLSPVAQVTFLDATGKDLGVKTRLPGSRFMHPGPVLLPFVLAPGAEATATLRWVSGKVYDHSVCITPARLHVGAGDAALETSLQGTLCGDAATGITVEQSRLASDPVYHR